MCIYVWLRFTARAVFCVALVGFLVGVIPATAQADETAKVALVGRLVANLDQSVEYYEALGFTKDPAESKDWSRDKNIEALFGVNGIETRVAKMQATTSASGKFFPVYLQEVRGIERRNLASRSMWKPTSTHIGYLIENVHDTWDKLRAAGILRPHSWADELAGPKGTIAYISDPDGLDVEVIDKGTNAKAGVNHFGIVVADIDKAKGFYVGLLGARPPAEEPKWLQGDFYDAAVGGHAG